MKKPYVWVVEVKNLDGRKKWYPKIGGVYYRTRKSAREWVQRFELEHPFNYQCFESDSDKIIGKQFGSAVKTVLYRAAKYVREI